MWISDSSRFERDPCIPLSLQLPTELCLQDNNLTFTVLNKKIA